MKQKINHECINQRQNGNTTRKRIKDVFQVMKVQEYRDLENCQT